MNALLESIHSPPAVAIADIVREKERGGEKIAKLQTGEPCFPTPRYIAAALNDALVAGHTGYSASQGLPELRGALSAWYKKDLNVDIDAAQILISVGGVGAIYCVMNALLNRDDEVIVIDPCWPQFVNIARLCGAKVTRIRTKATDGRLTGSLLEKHMSAAVKLIVINNPSNPAGIVYNESEINEFVEIAGRRGIHMLFDEVYNRLVFTDRFKSVLACDAYRAYRDRIVYVNSFSKTFAMTGWRLGYAFIHGDLLEGALKVSQNMITNVSTFSQYAAVEAVTEKDRHQDEFERMMVLYRERFVEVKSILDEAKIPYLKPDGAFYFFIYIGTDALHFAKMLLEKHKIAVVPGSAYGDEFDDYVRISFAVDQDSYSTFLTWLRNDAGSELQL